MGWGRRERDIKSTHHSVPSTSKTTPRSLGKLLLDSAAAPPSANGANRRGPPPCAAMTLANLRIRGAGEEDKGPARVRDTPSLEPMANR